MIPGAKLSAEELIEFCRGRVAAYKVPRYIKFVENFPQTASGKIQKFKLRETAASDFSLDLPSPVQR